MNLGLNKMFSKRLISSNAAFFKRFSGWIRLLKALISSAINILSNPSYIMFSVIAIGLGTMGIWIPFSPFYTSSTNEFDGALSILDNMSVFTFCVATLGNMATEYFFEEKGKDIEDSENIQNDEDYSSILSKHAAFFVWSLAFILSFFCLASDDYLMYGLASTLLLWLFVNINRPKFRAINRAAMKDLNPNLSKDGSRVSEDEFGGPGL